MKIKFLLILGFCLWIAPLLAKENFRPSISENTFSAYFNTQSFLPFQKLTFEYQPDQNQTVQVPGNYKSHEMGALCSLVIPGGGEFYTNYKTKAILFLGVEIAAWTTYAIHQNKGNDWQQQYQDLAAENWSEEKWQSWWQSLSPAQQEEFPRFELPESKNDEYYELIGKYEKYNAGWQDVSAVPGETETVKSPVGLLYMKWRHHSNSEFKLASAATAIVMANHVLSTLDAIWSVTRYNKKVKAAVRTNYVMVNSEPGLAVSLNVSW